MQQSYFIYQVWKSYFAMWGWLLSQVYYSNWSFFFCLFGFFNALLKLQDIIKDLYVANVSFFAECFLLETFTVLISSRFSSSVLKRFLCLWIFSITHWSCVQYIPQTVLSSQSPLLLLFRDHFWSWKDHSFAVFTQSWAAVQHYILITPGCMLSSNWAMGLLSLCASGSHT